MVFLQKPDKIEFFSSSFFIKLLEDRLEMLKIRDLVLHLFELKLIVLFVCALSYFDKSTGVIEIFLN